MNKPWMPPRPKFSFFANPPISYEGYRVANMAYTQFGNQFDAWFDREIRPLFESAVTVYRYENESDWTESNVSYVSPEKALLIKTQPIQKEETAEELLKNILNAFSRTDYLGSRHDAIDTALLSAKEYINKKGEIK